MFAGFGTKTTMTCTKANVSGGMTGINIMVSVQKNYKSNLINK